MITMMDQRQTAVDILAAVENNFPDVASKMNTLFVQQMQNDIAYVNNLVSQGDDESNLVTAAEFYREAGSKAKRLANMLGIANVLDNANLLGNLNKE